MRRACKHLEKLVVLWKGQTTAGQQTISCRARLQGLTVLHLDEVVDDIAHERLSAGTAPLEGDKIGDDLLVLGVQRLDVLVHARMPGLELANLVLEGVEGARVEAVRGLRRRRMGGRRR